MRPTRMTGLGHCLVYVVVISAIAATVTAYPYTSPPTPKYISPVYNSPPPPPYYSPSPKVYYKSPPPPYVYSSPPPPYYSPSPKESHNCPLFAAVSLCNLFDLVIADEDFEKGFSNEVNFNITMAANAETVRDFDEGLTRVDEYYSMSSNSKCIVYVCTPLFCIQTANDLIAPNRGIPRNDIKCKANPNCMLIVTPRGGHLGWVAGPEAPSRAPWTDPVVMEFLQYVESYVTISGERFLEDVHQIHV
ncbi:unnamed protein product [Arabis nemorensis]|uniref:Uncharacterized protein n=1 Tax=Arabis nemorensis TaxID=586526 RepID=A0A565BV74_9BRAS|nr:unnamed protein product [Arabis nemorensis]